MNSAAQISKRTLLKNSSALPVALALNAGVSAQSLVKADSRRVIADLLDVLIPQDTSPSATQLKVDEKIWEQAKSVPNYKNMLQQGSAWLDQQALSAGVPSGFLSMTMAQKNQVVAVALSQASMTLPRVFMERVLADAFRFYYGKKEAYQKINSMQPIQPLGYPNHHLAP